MTEPLYDARTFWELVTARAALSPEHPMLIDTAGRTLTFGELASRAERVAAGFHDLGVREGTTVSWQLPTRDRDDRRVRGAVPARSGAEPDHPHLPRT